FEPQLDNLVPARQPPAMAPPIITFRDVSIGFGATPLFDGLSFNITPGDRICLIGRNGCGKSTLMKLIMGDLEEDQGGRFFQPGLRLTWLPQDPVLEPEVTVREHIEQAGPPEDRPEPYEVDAALDRMVLDGDRQMGTLSGGEARRASLARALVRPPDVLLLDEPTNHLDLPTIEWLEKFLTDYRGATLIVSHDRAFLNRVTKRMWWLDRGRLRQTDRPFSEFEQWQEEVLNEDAREMTRMNTVIAQELRYLQRGVTGRRTRNQMRLRRLADMRDARSAVLGQRRGKVSLVIDEGEVRSRMIIEAKEISKSVILPNGKPRVIVNQFSTRILRGDRIGVLGPNGAGKTTLLRMLTGELKPDEGRVRVAKNAQPAYFDQHRSQLDPNKTLWETLCPEGGDSLHVRGEPRHVVGYLKDFLFSFDQIHSPVRTLSGGERNRLMLAKILAQKSDLLVLDEPTNDLDMETLDLLEDALGEFEGTLLIVSHDREFLDRTVASVIALEGDGEAKEYVGGYYDYVRQRGPLPGIRHPFGGTPEVAPKKPGPPKPLPPRSSRDKARLSFNEQRDLDELPDRITKLEAYIEQVSAFLADPDVYQRDPVKFEKAIDRLAEAKAAVSAAEERWLELETKREEVEKAS
ncbi:MAG: ABC-F family ATP-binding cassette domain-containing protein, partial [Alphaproteobacteria bacterium]